MANQKEYKIIIGGIQESIEGIGTLQDSLDRLGKKVEESGGHFKTASSSMDELAKTEQKIKEYNEEYQTALQSNKMVLQENSKAIKDKLDLEKAELTVSENLRETYAQKQQLLTAMGKVIKNTAGDTSELQAQYAQLNQELKDFDATLGNHQRNVGDYGQATKNLKQELREYQQEMANMLTNGVSKADPAFVALAKRAGELKDAMEDAGEEVKRFASDTKAIDDVINVAQSATAAFGLFKGAMSAFGMETEETEKAIQKLAGAMSIIQSLKQLSETLQNGSMTAKLFNNSLGLMTKGMQGASLGAKALRIALASIGIGIIIGLVSLLIENWEDLVGWFNKTFPVLNKLGGFMGTLKAAFVGFGKAILNWCVNPIKTFAKVLERLFHLDFAGAWQAATDGLKNQFQGTVDAMTGEFNKQMAATREEQEKAAAETAAKELKYNLDMLKAKKGAQAKYSREGIELQKKEFEQRKKAAKGNAEELKQIALDEANFYRECEEAKTAEAKKGAAARTKISKDAAKQREKEEAEAARKAAEEQKKIDEATTDLNKKKASAEKILAEEKLRTAEREYDQLVKENAEYSQLEAKLNEITKLQHEIEQQNNLAKYIEYQAEIKERFSGIIDAAEDFKTINEQIINGAIKSSDDVEKIFPQYTKKMTAEQLLRFKGLIQQMLNDWQEYQNKGVEIDAKAKEKLEQQTDKYNDKQMTLWKQEIDNATAVIEKAVAKAENISTSGTSWIFNRLFDKKKTKELEEQYKNVWKNIADTLDDELAAMQTAWSIYLEGLADKYGEDSKQYIEEQKKMYEAFKKYKKLREDAEKNSGGASSTSNLGSQNKSNKGKSPINKKENKVNDNGTTNWDAFWDGEQEVFENLQGLADVFYENVFDPIGEAFSALLEFQIEEAQEALDKATEMHDKSVQAVESSNQRLADIKNEMSNASGAQLEKLKQQQADEMLLLAQREAEEKRAAREKEKREKELAKKQKEQKKMELKMQLVEGIINTAVSVTKALTWGWPLGVVFAAIIGAMGAIQTAIIAKQISKLADGGLLQGKSHSQGGIPVGNTGIEVEGGEYVVNKRSTAKYLPLLQAINEEGAKKKTVANQLGKMADGGQINYQKASSNLESVNTNKVIESSIKQIDMHPQVSVVDINRGQKNLTTVRQMAGASK